MSSTYLADCADALLAAAAAGLASATTGRPVPSTQIVSHGAPPLDWCCDDGMLTVHVADVTHNQQYKNDLQQVPCGVEPRVQFVITVARCWPTMDQQGNLSPALVDAAAQDQLEDLWCLLTEVYDRAAAKTLFPGQITCGDVEVGAAVPVNAEGGCAGWEIPLSLTTNDTGPAGS